MIDNVNHPKHYTSHPSGVEAIEITRWLRGPYSNACKYVMRGWDGLKGDPIEDLQKAIWYLNDAERYPDDGKSLPFKEDDRFELWWSEELDDNKRGTVSLIISASATEKYKAPPIRQISHAKKLIQDRIAYLQSRPDVAL